MLLLETKNPLLLAIKTSIEDILHADTQAMSTFSLSDDLRHKILSCLVSYSAKIPHPASYNANADNALSNTLIRWQILAYVAGLDLTIAKWFESHLDALSILHELGYEQAAKGLWAVWAAEGHPDPIRYSQGKARGTKAWCSGANSVDNGLLTYRDEQARSCLLIINMHQQGIAIDNSAWQAVGMQATDTATIQFNEVAARPVGAASAYLDRAGFWHGAAGVAACWYGASAKLASYLISAYQQKPHAYKAMYLGQISTALAVNQQYFYYVAKLIDTQPKVSHELVIRQLRANTEQLARKVIEVMGQALGAAPFCSNAHFARLAADLPVFIRQSHGAFDLQKIGELASESIGPLSKNPLIRQEDLWQL
ncbi:acyl-CoA dehydrogenase [Psychrobacter sp. AH5]|uniref:acyl-CoA dehydrogenase n=1 Tax=Psychrobacter sp. AH5 TaxID=2937433 RepID=UPI00333F8E75